MSKNPVKLYKTLVIGFALLFFVALSPISTSNLILLEKDDYPLKILERSDCPINITVHEAWDLLNDTSNGIQIPIDIRIEEQWNEYFIDTPWPEHPRWFGNGTIQEFIEIYDSQDVVIYCKGGYKSLIFCLFLCDASFNGTVYNMNGGITAWIEEGYPIRNNTPPEAPKIKDTNPRTKPITGTTKNIKFTTIDPDDDKIYLIIDWGDGSTEGWIGPYDSGEEVTINHTYEQRSYTIVARAKDIFNAEGPEGTLEIPFLRSRQIIKSLFIGLFEQFPLLEVFLRIMNL